MEIIAYLNPPGTAWNVTIYGPQYSVLWTGAVFAPTPQAAVFTALQLAFPNLGDPHAK